MVGYGAVDGGQVEPGQEAHSASTEECMLCHNGRRIPETNFTHYYLNESSCLQCHDPVPAILAAAAGGFGGFTPDLDDTGANATHRSFVLEAIDDPLMEGENEACIGCHTDTSVNISHVIPQGYKLDLDRACDWDVKITSYNFTTVKGSE
jgi:nitrate/TMAO reductase-like tetraheme cytochrome c subunit